METCGQFTTVTNASSHRNLHACVSTCPRVHVRIHVWSWGCVRASVTTRIAGFTHTHTLADTTFQLAACTHGLPNFILPDVAHVVAVVDGANMHNHRKQVVEPLAALSTASWARPVTVHVARHGIACEKVCVLVREDFARCVCLVITHSHIRGHIEPLHGELHVC